MWVVNYTKSVQDSTSGSRLRPEWDFLVLETRSSQTQDFGCDWVLISWFLDLQTRYVSSITLVKVVITVRRVSGSQHEKLMDDIRVFYCLRGRSSQGLTTLHVTRTIKFKRPENGVPLRRSESHRLTSPADPTTRPPWGFSRFCVCTFEVSVVHRQGNGVSDTTETPRSPSPSTFLGGFVSLTSPVRDTPKVPHVFFPPTLGGSTLKWTQSGSSLHLPCGPE